jgi:uncharacterized membrane protein YbhN (UPF0104 family)
MVGRLRDWLLGSLLLALLVYWLHTRVGWMALLAPWAGFQWPELLWLLALSLGSYLFRAIRIHVYFHTALQGQFATTLRLSVLHNFANNLLPMRAGEALFPLLMRRYFGQRLLDSSLSLLWIRGLDLHVLMALALGSLWWRQHEWTWLLALVLWLAALLLVYPLRRPLMALLTGRSGRLAVLAGKVLLSLPDSQRLFLRVYLWTLLTWLSKFVAFASLLLHFLPMPLWQAILGVMAAELSSVLPIHGVAGAGSYELAMAAALVPMGMPLTQVVAAAVNLHLFLLGVTLMLGGTALLLPRPVRR